MSRVLRTTIPRAFNKAITIDGLIAAFGSGWEFRGPEAQETLRLWVAENEIRHNWKSATLWYFNEYTKEWTAVCGIVR